MLPKYQNAKIPKTNHYPSLSSLLYTNSVGDEAKCFSFPGFPENSKNSFLSG